MFLRKGCVLYTCNKFFEKLPECSDSASRRGYATGMTQRPGTGQLSVSSTAISYDVTLTSCDADHPHTRNIRCLHSPSKLYSSHPETTRSKVLFPDRWSLCWPTHTNDTDTVMTGEYAHRSDASHSPIIERILAEAGAYYTCELIFSLSTAMKSRSVYYT